VAEQVELNRQDYEKAIVRILSAKRGQDSKSVVVGTGFLIAPSYVMTCAHVVLQAIGVEQKDFATHEHSPEQEICLDFPLWVNVGKFQAEVVDWLSYDVSEGDVAILKLKGSMPLDIKPLPISQFSPNVEGDIYSVYGFGESSGDRSDAYTPKAPVYGRRLQLRKTGDPSDETIKPGYSGAPVWHEQQCCVIGMIATVTEERAGNRLSKAYAITREILEPVLKKISAFYLHDALEQSLAGCGDETATRQLESVIQATLKRCHPNADLQAEALSREAQLCALAIDLPPAQSWEKEGRLVWFAVQLAIKKTQKLIPQQLYEGLESWVSQQGFNFAELFVRGVAEIPEQAAGEFSQQHLIVVLDSADLSAKTVDVSIWPVADRKTYDLSNPPTYIEFEKKIPLDELPGFIRTKVRAAFLTDRPVIHLFVPPNLLNEKFEMQPCTTTRRRGLGCEYPFVLRMNFKDNPNIYTPYYRKAWQNKWTYLEEALGQTAIDVFEVVDCSLDESDLLDALEAANVAVLNNVADAAALFDLMVGDEIALPVALWIRGLDCGATSPSAVLDGGIAQLLERIRQERESAHQAKEKALLGYNLNLLWEDPKIVPPTTVDQVEQYQSEAY
jgi:hypothetical protein